MSQADGAPRKGQDGPLSDEEVLRAKYLDYCSAQLADFLVLLSPDQTYLLAQEAAKEAGITRDLSYDEIVRLATDRISSKLVLPPFELWLEDYLAHPEFYDRYLLGFWESDSSQPAPE